MFWGLKLTSPKCFRAWHQLHQKVFGVKINLTKKFSGLKSTLPKSFGTWNPLHQKFLGLETKLTRKFRGLTSIWSQFRSLWTGASLVGIWRPSFSRRQTGKFTDSLFLENYLLYCHFHFQAVEWTIHSNDGINWRVPCYAGELLWWIVIALSCDILCYLVKVKPDLSFGPI